MVRKGLQQLIRLVRADFRSGTERGRLVRATALIGAQNVIATLIVFCASLAYARGLGPHGYGLYAYVVASVAVLSIPVSMGIPQYLIRESAKSPTRLLQLRRWADSRILVSGTVAMILMSSVWLVPHAADARWLFVIAAPMPFLLSAAAVRSAFLQARGHVARSQWPRLVLSPALTLTVFVGVWFWRGGVSALDLMIGAFSATLLCLCVNAWQLRRIMPEGDRVDPGSATLRDALPFMWVAGLLLLNNRIDLLMLGVLDGAREAGVYAVASRAAELTSFLMTTANMILAPKIAQLYQAGQFALLKRMMSGATRRIVALSIPIALILTIGAKPILTQLYGDGFADGAVPLQVLAVAQIFAVASGPLATLLNMTGYERITAKNMLATVVLNIALNFILIPQYGAVGAAVATAASLLTSRAVLWYRARQHLRLREPIASPV